MIDFSSIMVRFGTKKICMSPKHPPKDIICTLGLSIIAVRSYVNGQLAGTHTGGYTSFNCEITNLIEEGDNLLVIKVDNTLKSDDIPNNPNGLAQLPEALPETSIW